MENVQCNQNNNFFIIVDALQKLLHKKVDLVKEEQLKEFAKASAK